MWERTPWRATFYTTGMEHSPTSATGTAWERTPWHATQRAARTYSRSEERIRMIPAPIKATVTRSALDALDIRIGTILEVEDVRGSAKLVRLVVSLGDHTRTILAALKKERANAA